jgi:predicted molibdopterin-dependent oxidoreductase YjgC
MREVAASVSLTVNGEAIKVKPGVSVAAAMLAAGQTVFRTSVSDQPRGPLCGMGICMECRVTINGRAHQKSCQILCAEGMVIEGE